MSGDDTCPDCGAETSTRGKSSKHHGERLVSVTQRYCPSCGWDEGVWHD